jgi:hypothetical protein
MADDIFRSMNRLLPRDQFPPGLDRGNYVALEIEEFRHAYDVFSASLDGLLPRDPDFPAEVQDAQTGLAVPLEDTPFNRAWFASGKLFVDDAKRVSFYARVAEVMPIALDRRYAKYVNRGRGSFHVALLGAVAGVAFSSRTKPKALRAAFDAEFRRRRAAVVDPGPIADRQ